MWKWWVLALVACKTAPERVQIEHLCEVTGRRVVVEGVFDAHRDMQCRDGACDFELRDNGHRVVARVRVPDGQAAITGKAFPGAPRGQRISMNKRSTITGVVVGDPPTCRIDIDEITQ